MTTLAIKEGRPSAPPLKAPVVDSTSLDEMTEANERLARVEQRLDSQGDTLTRLERHMETMSNAHSEMSKAMGQIPHLLEKNQEIHSLVMQQGSKIAVLEKSMESRQALDEHVRKRIEPKVNKSHFIANLAAWAAGTIIVIAAGAISRGIVTGDLAWAGKYPAIFTEASSPASADADSTPSTLQPLRSWRRSGSTSEKPL